MGVMSQLYLLKPTTLLSDLCLLKTLVKVRVTQQKTRLPLIKSFFFFCHQSAFLKYQQLKTLFGPTRAFHT